MKSLKLKYGKKAAFWIFYIAFTILLLAEIVLLRDIYYTVKYRGSSFKIHIYEQNYISMINRDDYYLTMHVELDEHSSEKIFTIECETGIMEFKYALGEDYVYCFSDGVTINVPFIPEKRVPHIYEQLNEAQKAEKLLIDKLVSYYSDNITNVENNARDYFSLYFLRGTLALLIVRGIFCCTEKPWEHATFRFMEGKNSLGFIFAARFAALFIMILIYFLPIWTKLIQPCLESKLQLTVRYL